MRKYRIKKHTNGLWFVQAFFTFNGWVSITQRKGHRIVTRMFNTEQEANDFIKEHFKGVDVMENSAKQQFNHRLQVSTSDGPIPVSKSDFTSKIYLPNEYIEVQCSYLQQLYVEYEAALKENNQLTAKLRETQHKAHTLEAAVEYSKLQSNSRIRLDMRA